MLGSCVTESYIKDSGMVFGTTYSITYQYHENLKSDIEDVMQQVDNSLSPFNKSSVITAINNNTSTKADNYLTEVFTLAQTVNKETDGAFDITVAPLVNAWGFGFRSGTRPTELQERHKTYRGADRQPAHHRRSGESNAQRRRDNKIRPTHYA